MASSPDTLRWLDAKGLVFLRYNGINPNGSTDNIAGITNVGGNVIGLMPHPERWVIREQHYDWQGQRNIQPWGLEFLRAIVRMAR